MTFERVRREECWMEIRELDRTHLTGQETKSTSPKYRTLETDKEKKDAKTGPQPRV